MGYEVKQKYQAKRVSYANVDGSEVGYDVTQSLEESKIQGLIEAQREMELYLMIQQHEIIELYHEDV